MSLLLTEEQVFLAESVRDWAAAVDALAAAHAERLDLLAGSAGALELGLLELLHPDVGGTYADLAAAAVECGRAGIAFPAVESAVAVEAARRAGVDVPEAGGLVLPVVAAPEHASPTAREESGSLVLSGQVEAVSAAAAATGFVLAADLSGEPVVAYLPADGVRVTARGTLDLTRGFATVALDETAVAAGGWSRADTSWFEDATRHAVTLDALGGASRLLDLTVRYVKEREQFGVPVGSFQAVKHHCATMALEVEASTAVARVASLALDDAPAHVRAHAVSAAAAYAKPACKRVAGMALQLHGGMGFTWEHDLHLLLRRVTVDELLGGTPAWHRERLARLVG